MKIFDAITREYLRDYSESWSQPWADPTYVLGPVEVEANRRPLPGPQVDYGSRCPQSALVTEHLRRRPRNDK